MKPRKLELGNRNMIGVRVTKARLDLGMKQVELLAKLQLAGVDMSVPALSLLEGQKRPVSDNRLYSPVLPLEDRFFIRKPQLRLAVRLLSH